MRCLKCGNEMTYSDAPFVDTVTNKIVTGIPHYICDKCCDMEFPAESLDKLDEIEEANND